MPIYTYRCTRCHKEHEELRSMDKRDLISSCPSCGQLANPVMSQVASPKFGIGVKGHYSREANSYVRSKPAGRNPEGQ